MKQAVPSVIQRTTAQQMAPQTTLQMGPPLDPLAPPWEPKPRPAANKAMASPPIH